MRREREVPRSHVASRRGPSSKSRAGADRRRWIVASCLEWLMNNRRLCRAYERKAAHFHAFADVACALP